MIKNQEQLQLTREQLARVQRALESLRRDVLPKSEARYRLWAESYEDEIRKLEAEIKAYAAEKDGADSSSASLPTGDSDGRAAQASGPLSTPGDKSSSPR